MAQQGNGPLKGKVAFVTGASRRIGRATALGLAREGADLLVNARSARDEVEAVAAEVRKLGRRAEVVMGDVSDEADVARMAGEAKAAGVVIYTIGLGADVEAEALAEIASRPEGYYPAPEAGALAGIYAQIAVALPCPAGAFWGGR